MYNNIVTSKARFCTFFLIYLTHFTYTVSTCILKVHLFICAVIMKEQKGVTIMKCLQYKNKEKMRNEKKYHYFICSPFNELLCFDNNYSSTKYYLFRSSQCNIIAFQHYFLVDKFKTWCQKIILKHQDFLIFQISIKYNVEKKTREAISVHLEMFQLSINLVNNFSSASETMLSTKTKLNKLRTEP